LETAGVYHHHTRKQAPHPLPPPRPRPVRGPARATLHGARFFYRARRLRRREERYWSEGRGESRNSIGIPSVPWPAGVAATCETCVNTRCFSLGEEANPPEVARIFFIVRECEARSTPWPRRRVGPAGGGDSASSPWRRSSSRDRRGRLRRKVRPRAERRG